MNKIYEGISWIYKRTFTYRLEGAFKFVSSVKVKYSRAPVIRKNQHVRADTRDKSAGVSVNKKKASLPGQM